jgi:glycosyltransferase involved in cell wall biosynthesis
VNKASKKQIRILHVVGGMNRGGAETWLMHVLRHIDRDRFRFDFLVHTDKPCAYDDEIRDLGSKIIPCLVPSQPWRYAVNFTRILKEYGPYDAVHSHVHHYSGFVLWLAERAGIPIRISHSHSDTSQYDSKAGIIRKVYLRITERLVGQYATNGVACSDKAAAALFGPEWKKNGRQRILYCGVDLRPFSETVVSAQVRRELGIPIDAYVVGHVGRFSEVKNHVFLLDIVRCMVEHDPNVRCLLVGDGPLRQEIEEKVNQLGLKDKVIFTGLRSDVPRLMMGAMNVFLLPSLNEGLPLVSIEAQAAGLPCVFSEVIPEEADAVGSLVHRVALNLPAQKWVDVIIDVKNETISSKKQPLDVISQSSFNIIKSVAQLEKIYAVYAEK